VNRFAVFAAGPETSEAVEQIRLATNTQLNQGVNGTRNSDDKRLPLQLVKDDQRRRSAQANF
jgi:hypothetical protein